MTEIAARPARQAEFPQIRSLLARAFQGDEADLWEHLVAHDPTLQPENVLVAEADGRPVACTVLLPRQIRTRRGWTPGAIVTLVACDPAYQNRGLGGATVKASVAAMQQRGMALGILYGHPGYYPRFGFVPVLPSLVTTLSTPAAPAGAEPLAPATEADLPRLQALHAQQGAQFICAVDRDASPWIWSPRTPAKNGLLLLPDQAAYAQVHYHTEQEQLYVSEAAGESAQALRRLLASLQAVAVARSLTKVKLGLPPEHPLVRLAHLAGAEQLCRPASAGMAVVANWAPLLPEGYAVEGSSLLLDGRVLLQTSHAALVQLALGYRPVGDLLLMAETRVTGGGADLARLAADFPPTFPKWSLAPFWS